MKRRSFCAAMGGCLFMSGGGQAKSETAFYVPAEEAPHEATFMQWPVTPAVYRNRGLRRAVQATIANIANTIAQFEPVIMLAGRDHHAAARKLLSSDVTLWDIATDDLWCRDSGPIFAVNDAGMREVLALQFDGWGGEQRADNDREIAANVAARLGLAMRPTGLHGEGGSLDHDGAGLLIAHESSWVDAKRNPGLSRAEIERRLLSAYGAQRMIWAPGVQGLDITDYHIDSLARFTAPGRVLMNLPDAPVADDPFHQAALETHDILLAAGMEIDVISEPNFRRVADPEFVASYANYYVCNQAVIAAQFGDRETDARAQKAFERHYPGREIVMLNVDVLGELGGGIHCATQQMPAV